jgi:hypothetical protein
MSAGCPPRRPLVHSAGRRGSPGAGGVNKRAGEPPTKLVPCSLFGARRAIPRPAAPARRTPHRTFVRSASKPEFRTGGLATEQRDKITEMVRTAADLGDVLRAIAIACKIMVEKVEDVGAGLLDVLAATKGGLSMSEDDDDLPSKEELAEAAKATGIDCLATRLLMAIGVEVLERLGSRLDEFAQDDLAAGRHLLGKDMHAEGAEPFEFSDEALANLRREAREIVNALVHADR